jgi:hypothetical protein
MLSWTDKMKLSCGDKTKSACIDIRMLLCTDKYWRMGSCTDKTCKIKISCTDWCCTFTRKPSYTRKIKLACTAKRNFVVYSLMMDLLFYRSFSTRLLMSYHAGSSMHDMSSYVAVSGTPQNDTCYVFGLTPQEVRYLKVRDF